MDSWFDSPSDTGMSDPIAQSDCGEGSTCSATRIEKVERRLANFTDGDNLNGWYSSSFSYDEFAAVTAQTATRGLGVPRGLIIAPGPLFFLSLSLSLSPSHSLSFAFFPLILFSFIRRLPLTSPASLFDFSSSLFFHALPRPLLFSLPLSLSLSLSLSLKSKRFFPFFPPFYTKQNKSMTTNYTDTK